MVGIGVGAGVGKIFATFRPGFAGYHPSTDCDFGRTVMHRLENTEILEGKERSSVEIRFECHLVIEFGLKRVSEKVLGPSKMLCNYVNKFPDLIRAIFKGISDNHGRLHPPSTRTDCCVTV